MTASTSPTTRTVPASELEAGMTVVFKDGSTQPVELVVSDPRLDEVLIRFKAGRSFLVAATKACQVA